MARRKSKRGRYMSRRELDAWVRGEDPTSRRYGGLVDDDQILVDRVKKKCGLTHKEAVRRVLAAYKKLGPGRGDERVMAEACHGRVGGSGRYGRGRKRMRRNPFAQNLSHHLHVSRATGMEPMPYDRLDRDDESCSHGYSRVGLSKICVPKKTSRQARREVWEEDWAERAVGMTPNRSSSSVASAAKMIAKRDHVSLKAATKYARKAARRMPGHPTAKAIAAEARVTGKSRTRTGKMPVGTGQRFRAMVSALMREGHSEKSAKAIAAAHGRKKYGAKYFNELARMGRRRAKARRERRGR